MTYTPNEMLTPPDQPDIIQCENCDGTGRIYFLSVNGGDNYREVSKNEYDAVKAGEWVEKDYETCKVCGGEGRI